MPGCRYVRSRTRRSSTVSRSVSTGSRVLKLSSLRALVESQYQNRADILMEASSNRKDLPTKGQRRRSRRALQRENFSEGSNLGTERPESRATQQVSLTGPAVAHGGDQTTRRIPHVHKIQSTPGNRRNLALQKQSHVPG